MDEPAERDRERARERRARRAGASVGRADATVLGAAARSEAAGRAEGARR